MFYNISIIIPFYNASKLISASLKSSKNIIKKIKTEIIYVDNNSNDNSPSIIKKKIKSQKNIILLKTRNYMGKGPGVGRNLGIKHAKGKRILFLDVDDELSTDNIKKLIQFLKGNNSNLIYLGRKLVKNRDHYKEKLSPFIKYNKKNLSKFFTNSNNMNVIFVLFNKKFLIKNKLSFDKGMHEDIFFLFKAHFYNQKNIKYFSKKIYLKKSHKNSITHSPLTLDRIKGMFLAWRNIDGFLKRKMPKLKYKKIYKYIQYRWRGELANEYSKILNCKLRKNKEKFFLNYLIKNYKKNISLNFKAKTKKDKIVKNLLWL
jgi:glycosyltransferase involved in cell wall biosynthesis|tara:strand:+ start:363 stop:1310 length:948 start_codon:yes stop_codon:yes gene_type:complete